MVQFLLDRGDDRSMNFFRKMRLVLVPPVCVCARARVRVCARARVRVCACVRACV